MLDSNLEPKNLPIRYLIYLSLFLRNPPLLQLIGAHIRRRGPRRLGFSELLRRVVQPAVHAGVSFRFVRAGRGELVAAESVSFIR